MPTVSQDTTLRASSLIGAIDRFRQITQWTRGDVRPNLGGTGLLHQAFEEQARRHPERTAVLFEGQGMTYRELDRAAERVARQLRAGGMGPGDFVAFRMDRSLEVYPILIGVLKSGAAYVPIDIETPVERAAFILSNCGARLLVTSDPAMGGHVPATCGVSMVTPALDLRLPPCDGAPAAREPRPYDLCYVIYTSGSTGRPKGVAIEHRSAIHLVRAEQDLFAFRPTDRVLQGFSLSFDAAVEETWAAFASGATLVVAARDVLLSGLGTFLNDSGITVFSCVPALLAVISEDLPTVRLLIVGGEACPDELANRWATSQRTMFNTYGPTEATVIATYARLHAGQKVTIGRPVPNYFVYILDSDGNLLPSGIPGEICIAGIGLARGYIQNPELTARAFVPNPIREHQDLAPVIYKTGDRGRYDDEGQIEFLGRIDLQVKMNGFRIELGDVESALMACPGVALAAATVHESVPGLRRLCAYVVCQPDVPVSATTIKDRLRTVLPGYMIPSRVQFLPRLPLLTSGKIDRSALPADGHDEDRSEGADDWPRDTLERRIADVWAALFHLPRVGVNDDFFDLGGHSLLVAQSVSRLREHSEFDDVSIGDLYDCPSVAKLADRVREGLRAKAERDAGSAATTPAGAVASDAPAAARSKSERGLFAIFQLGALYVVIGLYSLEWIAPYGALVWLIERGAGDRSALLAAAAVLLALPPAMLVLALAIKWAVIGRYRPGRYPLWGWYYLRWWFVERVLDLTPMGFLAGTPLMNAYCRLLGARIGDEVLIATEDLRSFDLIEVGDGSTIGAESLLTGASVERGYLILGGVRVGKGCVVGSRVILSRETSLADDADLDDMSLLPVGSRIATGETWGGSPAVRVPRGRSIRSDRASAPSIGRRALLTAGYALTVLCLPALIVLAFLPALAGLVYLHQRWAPHSSGTALQFWALGGDLRYLWAVPLAAVCFLACLCGEMVLVKWVLLPKSRPGRYPVWGGYYFRRWIFDQAMSLTMEVAGELYGTMFLNPWYRLLGIRVGKLAEISTASGFTPGLLDIGDGAFVADAVSLGNGHLGDGYLDLQPTSLGKRSFAGNSAFVAAGTHIGDDSLIGCLSTTPGDLALAGRSGASWFGSPAIELPQRQRSVAFSSDRTYEPSRGLVVQRAAMETLRVLVPCGGVIAFTCLLLNSVVQLSHITGRIGLLAMIPVLFAGFGVMAAMVAVVIKWAVVGRYRPAENPLWSGAVWRSEFVTAVQENLANPFLLDMLLGTPYLPWFFRAMGTKIGRGVYMDTTEITEYDLVSIGDDVCLNGDCTLQTHLFEDRVMKMSTVTIGNRCSVGAGSIVLYDTRMESEAQLGPLSLLMKGEVLRAGPIWQGVPARKSPR